jgi:hypothetical protein
MADDFTFYAPTGAQIQGLLQHDSSTWRVRWIEDDPTKVDYVGDGAEPDWNTVEWHDQPVYVDYDGSFWFAHHLVRHCSASGDDDDAGHPPAAIALMVEEVTWTRRAHLMRELALSFSSTGDSAGYRTWQAQANTFSSCAILARERWEVMIVPQAPPPPIAVRLAGTTLPVSVSRYRQDLMRARERLERLDVDVRQRGLSAEVLGIVGDMLRALQAEAVRGGR